MDYNTTLKIDQLVDKANDALAKYRMLQQENIHLKETIIELETKLNNFQSFEAKPTPSTDTHIENTKDMSKIRAEIDEYIQEIDQCILMLNQ